MPRFFDPVDVCAFDAGPMNKWEMLSGRLDVVKGELAMALGVRLEASSETFFEVEWDPALVGRLKLCNVLYDLWIPPSVVDWLVEIWPERWLPK